MDNLKDKKVLFVIDNMSFGGAQKLVLDQINHLHKIGYDISLLTLIPEKRDNFKSRVRLPKEKVYSFETGLNLSSIFFLRSFFKRQGYDFVFSNLFYSNTLIRLAIATLLKRPRIIIYEHNVYALEKSKASLLLDWVLSLITLKIIAVSNEVKNYLINEGHIKQYKIAVVRNGIEFPCIDQQIVLQKKKELGIDPEATLVVAVGNVDYQKGHDFLLEAANLIKDRNFIYLICGRTKNRDLILNLNRKIEEYGLLNNFKLLGDRVDVLEIVAAADIFAMPSRWEGLSIALLEAMALKKAVVVSEIPSMQELVVSQKNGLKFKLGNIRELADNLILLANDPQLRERLGTEAYKFVQDFYIGNCVRSLLNTISFSLSDRSNVYNLTHQSSNKWSRRTDAAVAMIKKIDFERREVIVGDFGCGDKKVLKALKNIESLNFAYLAYDVIPQYDDVTKINFSYQFPDKKFDLAFSLGLIEYLSDVDFYFDNLSKRCMYVILSCVINDRGHYTKEQIRKNGWVNYFSSNDLVKIITRYNFEIIDTDILDNGVTYLAIIKNKKSI